MDLRKMSGVDACDWLAKSEHGSYYVARAFIDHGITETDVIDRWASAHEIVADLPREVMLDSLCMPTLSVLGARAWLEDPDNREDWAVLAQRMDALDQHLSTMNRGLSRRKVPHTGQTRHRYTGAMFVVDVLAAGRGPGHARRLLDVAERHEAEPDVHGFDLTPEAVDDLLTAGFDSPAMLRAFTDAGLTREQAIDLAHQGVSAVAALWGRHLGIPWQRWATEFEGIPHQWLGSELSVHDSLNAWRPDWVGSPIRAGYTLDDLRYLATHGWQHERSYSLLSISWGSGRRSRGEIALTPQLARRLADADLTPGVFDNYATALTQGNSHDSAPRSLVHWADMRDPEHAVAGVIALKQASVPPSALTDYKWSGCASVEQIIKAVGLGITPKRVRHLRAKYGKGTRYGGRGLRIFNFEHLIRHHESEPA